MFFLAQIATGVKFDAQFVAPVGRQYSTVGFPFQSAFRSGGRKSAGKLKTGSTSIWRAP
jgi:hypothetical protein